MLYEKEIQKRKSLIDDLFIVEKVYVESATFFE